MARREGYHREQKLKRRYGLTQKEYDQMLADQGGGCALCGTSAAETKLFVDHCHDAESKGRILVRGLLCSSCNTGLGMFKDNPAALRRAVAYLVRNGS